MTTLINERMYLLRVNEVFGGSSSGKSTRAVNNNLQQQKQFNAYL